MKQLHYTYSPEHDSITIHNKTGTITLSLKPEIIKKLNENSQTVADPNKIQELQKINEELHQRYVFIDSQKFNTRVRKINIEKILQREEERLKIFKSITKT